MKFHENPSGGSLVFFRADRGADKMTLIVVFRNFANATNNIESGEILSHEFLKFWKQL